MSDKTITARVRITADQYAAILSSQETGPFVVEVCRSGSDDLRGAEYLGADGAWYPYAQHHEAVCNLPCDIFVEDGDAGHGH